jgi:hypothetical protein
LSEVAAIPVGSDVAMSPSSYVTAETLKDGDPGEYRVTEPLLKQFAIYVP